MESLLDSAQIAHLLSTYGYWAIFFVVMLESAGLPLPGETVLVGSAIYAARTGNTAIEHVILSATAGAILGDNIGYWVGREFGTTLLQRHGALFSVTPKKLHLGQYLFSRWGGSIVFFGRFIALMRVLAAVLAGANRLEPTRFILFNALGGIVWAHVFGLGAYYFTADFKRLEGPIAMTLFMLVLIGTFYFWRYFKKHETRLVAEAEADYLVKSAAQSSERACPPGGIV